MNTEELALAYETLLEAVADASFRRPPEDEWDAALILAHLVANDWLLASAVSEVLAGHSPAYDNATAIDVDRVVDAVAQAGSVGHLVGQLRFTSYHLVDLAAKLDDGQLATMIPARIVDGDTVQVDQPLPLAAILRAQTTLHLPSHRDQLAALATS